MVRSATHNNITKIMPVKKMMDTRITRDNGAVGDNQQVSTIPLDERNAGNVRPMKVALASKS